MPVSGSDNRDAILRSLEDRGVLYDLVDGVFRYCDERGVLSEAEETAIDVCRASLTEHLRRQRGLCLTCDGTPQQATRPNFIKAIRPPLWCEACWTDGSWKSDVVKQQGV